MARQGGDATDADDVRAGWCVMPGRCHVKSGTKAPPASLSAQAASPPITARNFRF